MVPYVPMHFALLCLVKDMKCRLLDIVTSNGNGIVKRCGLLMYSLICVFMFVGGYRCEATGGA